MTRRSTQDLHQELARLLRAGDPAGDGRDPDPTELQAWRRKILTAGESPHSTLPRRGRRLLLPTAAVVVLAALFSYFLLPGRFAPTLPAPQIAASPGGAPVATGSPAGGSAGVLPAPAAPAPAIAAPSPGMARASLPGNAHEGSPSRMVAVTTPPDAAANPAAAARTVRFTAPGGTRVIWTLNPDLQLTVRGGKS